MLNILENYDLVTMGHNSPTYAALLTELMKYAYADRSKYLGDPDFFDVPVQSLISKEYAKNIYKKIKLNSITPSEKILPGSELKHESLDTTHFSVADMNGNFVSNTYTLNSGFGSGVIVDGTGVLMNNEMDDFVSAPGVPNQFGLVGGEANKIEPFKRPLSSMTPTIVLKDKKPYLILGTPGGSTIITTVFQNILNVVVHNMNIKESVDAPRFHSQWLPDQIDYEKNSLSEKTINELIGLGHKLEQRGYIGEANGIMINDDMYWGGADKRGENTAIGY